MTTLFQNWINKIKHELQHAFSLTEDKAKDEEIENKRQELQNALDELVKRGVQWRESEN